MGKTTALLPIKQHSERVKGKNFRKLCGKPLYTWILDTLLSCQQIDEVVIDTDSQAFIEELHSRYPQVRTLLRPESIRGGSVSMNRIIEYDMSQCPDTELFVQTHTTNPLLSSESIDSAIRSFYQSFQTNDSLFSVNRIQARTYWADGSAINHTLGELKRTQDLEPIFEENSNLFLFTRESFSKTNSRLGQTPLLFETKPMESLEIDEEEDFLFVELVLSAILNQRLAK